MNIEEKKLTDEEIVKALGNCENLVACEGCLLKPQGCIGLALDLIHRLQADNIQLKWNYVDLKERYVKVLDLNEKVIAEQKAEIERLTEENEKVCVRKNEVLHRNLELRKQNEAWKERAKELETAWDISSTNEEKLQKQVDELKAENTELYKEHTALIAGSILAKQNIAKDTAKEICDLILEHWEKKQFVECDWLRVAISERYGVEVE